MAEYAVADVVMAAATFFVICEDEEQEEQHRRSTRHRIRKQIRDTWQIFSSVVHKIVFNP